MARKILCDRCGQEIVGGFFSGIFPKLEEDKRFKNIDPFLNKTQDIVKFEADICEDCVDSFGKWYSSCIIPRK